MENKERSGYIFLNPALILPRMVKSRRGDTIKFIMILKTSLHFHAAEDEKISLYGIYEAIDYAEEKGFDVLAYTPHRKFLFKKEYAQYAAKREILFIPGMEGEIKKRHFIILNCDKKAEEIKSFEDLKNYKIKNPQILVVAPHPFVFSARSLNGELLKHVDLFDAVEMSVFSNKMFNFNKKAEEVAKKYNKPFIATSDVHFLKDLERGYALVEAETKTTESILADVKNGNFKNKMDAMSPFAMLKHQIKGGLNFISASLWR